MNSTLKRFVCTFVYQPLWQVTNHSVWLVKQFMCLLNWSWTQRLLWLAGRRVRFPVPFLLMNVTSCRMCSAITNAVLCFHQMLSLSQCSRLTIFASPTSQASIQRSTIVSIYFHADGDAERCKCKQPTVLQKQLSHMMSSTTTPMQMCMWNSFFLFISAAVMRSIQVPVKQQSVLLFHHSFIFSAGALDQ